MERMFFESAGSSSTGFAGWRLSPFVPRLLCLVAGGTGAPQCQVHWRRMSTETFAPRCQQMHVRFGKKRCSKPSSNLWTSAAMPVTIPSSSCFPVWLLGPNHPSKKNRSAYRTGEGQENLSLCILSPSLTWSEWWSRIAHRRFQTVRTMRLVAPRRCIVNVLDSHLSPNPTNPSVAGVIITCLSCGSVCQKP